mmetsp:Transcript_8894/g.19923  ORF Transcript_8894/g.19923 Transcript_8894/m.19923 type:complete len:82 (+) Transcript_8894:775-1020(+)
MGFLIHTAKGSSAYGEDFTLTCLQTQQSTASHVASSGQRLSVIFVSYYRSRQQQCTPSRCHFKQHEHDHLPTKCYVVTIVV